METHRGAGEAVAVGGDDSTFTTCEKLAAIRHPGTAGHLQEGQETERENWFLLIWLYLQKNTSVSQKVRRRFATSIYLKIIFNLQISL